MIFENAFFTEMLLPFLLVFVVVFAILQKSKILGDGKAQIDAIVGMVVGLILIGYSYQTGVIISLMAWLAVGVAIILVFMILYGFVAGDLSAGNMPKELKYTFGALAGIFTVGIVLYVSGLWENLWDSFGGSSEVWMNVVMVFLVLTVIGVAIKGGKSGKRD